MLKCNRPSQNNQRRITKAPHHSSTYHIEGSSITSEKEVQFCTLAQDDILTLLRSTTDGSIEEELES